MTVSVTPGGSYNAIATAVGQAMGTAATLRNVNAENASAAGIRVSGSANLGPSVNATQNMGHGLQVNIPALSIGFGRPVVTIVDTPSLAGPSNTFSLNAQSGAVFFGDLDIDVDGANFSTNVSNGLVIGTPFYGLVPGGQPRHRLRNVHADTNGLDGLRLLSGDVLIEAGNLPNTFSGNGSRSSNTQGYGIHTTAGDSSGGALLELEASFNLLGEYLLAHEANTNRLGGVMLNQTSPVGFGAHQINSLEASRNGNMNTFADGVAVQIAGVNSPNQPSARLRGNRLTGNSGASVRFQRGNSNTLDIGTTTGIVVHPGYNIFADPGVKAGKTAVCFDNLAGGAVVQEAEANRWSTTVCPYPLGMPPDPTFIAQVLSCYRNKSYVDVTYVVPAMSSVQFSASSCF